MTTNATVPSRRHFASGLVVILASIPLVAVSLWRGSERTGDFGSLAVVGFLWLCLFGVWFLDGLFVLIAQGQRISLGHLLVRAVIPLLFLFVGLFVFSDAALDLRFGASRGELDRAADAMPAGVATSSGWVGLYPVDSIERTGQVVRVRIAGGMTLVRDGDGSDPDLTYERLDERWSIELDADFLD